MSNNSSLAKEICKVSFESHDYVWELPMWEEFQSELDSNFADIANIGKRCRFHHCCMFSIKIYRKL